MQILLEVIVKFFIIIIMLKLLDLLNDRNKVAVAAGIGIVFDFALLSMNYNENIIGFIACYLFDILIIAGLCKDIKEGLLYGICFQIIIAIFSIIAIYYNIYVSSTFYQLMPCLTVLLTACLLFVIKYFGLIKYTEKNMLLYIINVVCLIGAIYFNRYLTTNYELMPDIFYWGFVILGIWLIVNVAYQKMIK